MQKLKGLLLLALFCATGQALADFRVCDSTGYCEVYTDTSYDFGTARVCNADQSLCYNANATITAAIAGVDPTPTPGALLCFEDEECQPFTAYDGAGLTFCSLDGATCQPPLVIGSAALYAGSQGVGAQGQSAGQTGTDFSGMLVSWATIVGSILGVGAIGLVAVLAWKGTVMVYDVVRGVGSSASYRSDEPERSGGSYDDSTGRAPSFVDSDGTVYPNGRDYGNTPERHAALMASIYEGMSADEIADYERSL